MLTHRHIAAGVALAGVILAALVVSPDVVFGHARGLILSPFFPALLVVLYLIRPFVAWPISLLSALVGYRYGVAIGLPVALVGTVFTSLPAFAAGRWFPSRTGIAGWVTDRSERYFAGVGDLRGLVVARLAPTPAEATSTAAGLAGLSIPVFILGTLVGELPWTIAAVLAGASLAAFDVTALEPDPRLVVAGIIAGALLVAGPVYRLLVGPDPE